MSRVLEPTGGGLGSAARGALPLFVSIALLLVGSGLAGTLLGVRAGYEGFAPGVIGLVLAAYYAGYVAGSLFAPGAIKKVGHIRVFGGLAALASAALLCHLIVVDPLSWFLLRFVVGLCLSALYVVCETWLNGIATNRTRGGLLAIYMIIVSGSILGGQGVYALVGARGFEPFVIASILVSLAVVPVSLVAFHAPALPDPVPISLRRIARIAPLAITGTAVSGFVGAAMLSAGVVYASQAHFNRGATGAFIGASLAGGVALQFPLGRLSDVVDRRAVLAVSSLIAAGVALVTSQVSTDRRLVLIALTTLAGGIAYPMYSLAVAHLNDYVDDELKVAAGSKMILVNGYGAIAGPIVGSFAIGHFSPSALFVVIAVGYVIAALHAVLRLFVRSAPAEDERATFAPVAVGVGPTGIPADDVDLAELLPLNEGDAEVGELVVRFEERGTGPPVVLVGDVIGAEGDVWDDLMAPLATDGFHAIAPRLGSGHVDEGHVIEAVLSVLRHLEVPSASFVGFASGARLVRRLAHDHADRVDALALLVDETAQQEYELATDPLLPTLVVDRRRLSDSPSDAADDIAEFLRPIVAAIAAQWETGKFETVKPEV